MMTSTTAMPIKRKLEDEVRDRIAAVAAAASSEDRRKVMDMVTEAHLLLPTRPTRAHTRATPGNPRRTPTRTEPDAPRTNRERRGRVFRVAR